MIIEWSYTKNKKIKSERGFGFEDVVIAINQGRVLSHNPHDKSKYEHQHVLIVEINEYAVVVPYVVKDEGSIFLKTAFPSRKATKLLLGKNKKGNTDD